MTEVLATNKNNKNMISGQVEPQLIELTVWPVTTGISWCGKFEATNGSNS